MPSETYDSSSELPYAPKNSSSDRLYEDESPTSGLLDVVSVESRGKPDLGGVHALSSSTPVNVRDMASLYHNQAMRLRRQAASLRTVELILVAVLPVAISLTTVRWIYALISSLLFLTVAFQLILRLGRANVYEQAAQALEQELRLYIARAGIYESPTDHEGRETDLYRRELESRLAIRVAGLVPGEAGLTPMEW